MDTTVNLMGTFEDFLKEQKAKHGDTIKLNLQDGAFRLRQKINDNLG